MKPIYSLNQHSTYSKVGREGVGFSLKTTAQDIATPATALVAAQALAKIDPVEMVKEVKKLQPLAVEYNGKSFSSKGATIKMQPGDMAGVMQSTGEIPLICGFDLKNTVEGDPITWRLETSNGTVLPLEAPLRTSASSKDTYLGIQWPDGQNSLKLSVVSGERSLHFTLLKPDWKLSGLQIADGGRVAKAGETLYLVKAPLKDEKATVSWTSNIDPMLLNKHYFVNGTPSPLNLTAHKIPYTFSSSPSKTTYRLNALGYDESVKVEVVDEDRQRIDYTEKASALLVAFERLTGVYKSIKTWFPCEFNVMSSKELSDLVKAKQLKIALETFKEENENNPKFKEVRQFDFAASGFDLASFKCEKKFEIPIPFTSYKIPLAKAGLEIVTGLKGGVKARQDKDPFTKTTSYGKSYVYGGGYLKPKIYAGAAGVNANIEIEAGIQFQYPYKSNYQQMALLFYLADTYCYLDVDKDVSLFLTKNFRYELFKINTKTSYSVSIDF